MSCFVSYCKNIRRLLPVDSKISFHRFPKEEPMFRKWLQAIGRNDPNISWLSSMLVCSEHFEPEQLMKNFSRTHLLATAVPTIIDSKKSDDTSCLTLREPSEDPLSFSTTTASEYDSKEAFNQYSPNMIPIKQERKVSFLSDTVSQVFIETGWNSSITKTNEIESNLDDPVICKTCSEEFSDDPHRVTSSINDSRTTYKDMIIQLVPQMVDNLNDTDVICAKCHEVLTSCVKFIHRCLQIEAELRKESSEIIEVNQNCNDEVIEIEDDLPATEAPATTETNRTLIETNDDHSYVSKPLPEEVTQHDTILSVKQPNDKVVRDMVANFAKAGIRVFDCYSRSKRQLRTKRVLLLGTAIPPKLVKCEECGKAFRNKTIALRHEQTHKRVRERKELRQRMALQRKEERKRARLAAMLEAPARFQCPTCRVDCKSKVELKEHISTHPLLECEVCGKGFAYRHKLRVHVRTHNQTNSYVCDVCGRCYGTLTLLKQHALRHEEGKFLCSKCPKIFRHSLGLKHHMKRHESNSLYECKECGKKCKAKSALHSHYRLVHLKNGNFKCEICGEVFVRGDYLKRHVNKHMKSQDGPEVRARKDHQGPFVCKLCDKVFSKLLGLKHHLFTHASLKPYRCRYCGLTFNRLPNKYRHEKRHRKDPYAFNNKCPVCWRLCENQEELMEHISHHPTPYQCHSCDKAFARRYLLTHHVSENHTILTEESMFYKSILQESLDVKYPRTEFLFENDAAET